MTRRYDDDGSDKEDKYDEDDEICLYLRSEIEEVTDRWDELLKLGDEDALAMLIGRRIMHVQRVPKVSRQLVVLLYTH